MFKKFLPLVIGCILAIIMTFAGQPAVGGLILVVAMIAAIFFNGQFHSEAADLEEIIKAEVNSLRATIRDLKKEVDSNKGLASDYYQQCRIRLDGVEQNRNRDPFGG